MLDACAVTLPAHFMDKMYSQRDAAIDSPACSMCRVLVPGCRASAVLIPACRNVILTAIMLENLISGRECGVNSMQCHHQRALGLGSMTSRKNDLWHVL